VDFGRVRRALASGFARGDAHCLDRVVGNLGVEISGAWRVFEQRPVLLQVAGDARIVAAVPQTDLALDPDCGELPPGTQ